ncbi:MAG: hypothetical protein U9Q21_00800 [Candidatus Auribacterota bacterium]|nr:hypothetical protein [Candidatus Auribacterota bacterium]
MNEHLKELKRFGIGFGSAMILVGSARLYFKGAPSSWIFICVGVYALFSGLLFPKLLLPLHFLLKKIFGLIMYVFTVVFLSMVFYLVFTPIALILKLKRQDFMSRKIDEKESSYWVKRKPPGTLKEDYLKQY